MSIVGWLVLGLIVGILANWLTPGGFPGGIFGTILGGAFGAFLGGALFSLLFDRGVSGFDLASLIIAFVGAVMLLGLLLLAGRAEPDRRLDPRARA
jgi:uncharacterized membrane protein YeaQ/YmgE (transglycosylase-associated protein family)